MPNFKAKGEIMEQCLLNRKTIRKNKQISCAQKNAKKYYGDKLFAKDSCAFKTKIRKFANLENIDFIDDAKCIPENAIAINTKKELLKSLEKSGITGRSGNKFPVAEKIKAYKAQNGILLVNGVECDPGLFHDAWICRNKLQDVAEGIKILNEIFSFSKIILATKEPIQKSYSEFQQVKIRDRFPMGYENALIKTILGVELSENEHPSDKGILVMNIQTVLAVSDLAKGFDTRKFRYLTILDEKNAQATVMKALIGTKITDAVAKTKINLNCKIYAGSGAMGCHEISEDEKIAESTCFISCGIMTDYEKAKKCIGCGACSRNCPQKVNVRGIIALYEKSGKVHNEDCKKLNISGCIGCGACTYFCNAGKNTRMIVQMAKENLTK